MRRLRKRYGRSASKSAPIEVRVLVGHRAGPHGEEPIYGIVQTTKFTVYFFRPGETQVRTRTIRAMPGMTGQDAMKRVRELIPDARVTTWTPY